MDNLTELYCHIDDFYQAFKPQFERQLIENGTKRLRACKISVPEIMTILVLFHQLRYRQFKGFYYHHMLGMMKKDFSEEDIQKVADTYHNWKLGGGTLVPQNSNYEDIKGFCKSASLEEVQELNYVLTAGRYVGLEENDDEFDFKERFETLQNELKLQMSEEKELNDRILENLSKIAVVDE